MKYEGDPTPTPFGVVTADRGTLSIFVQQPTSFNLADLAQLSKAQGSHLVLTNCPTGKIEKQKLIVDPGRLCYGKFVPELTPQPTATNTVAPSQKEVVVIANARNTEGDWAYSLCCLIPIGLAVVAVVLSRWSRPKNELQRKNDKAVWDGSTNNDGPGVTSQQVSDVIMVRGERVESIGMSVAGRTTVIFPPEASIRQEVTYKYGAVKGSTETVQARVWGERRDGSLEVTTQRSSHPDRGNPIPCEPITHPLPPDVEAQLTEAAVSRAVEDYNNGQARQNDPRGRVLPYN